MKPTKMLLVLAFMLFAPAVASAQGYGRGGGGGGYYASQPPTYQLPGGFWNRQGRLTFGGSIGLGGMSDRFGDIECTNCDYNPISGMIEGHIGGFIGPRLALLGEVQVNGQTVSQVGADTTTLVQSTLMIAAQYWITPQLWIKGGIGFANLRLEESYYGDGIVDATSIPENGVALMGAVGYELLSARYFSIDLQGRLINGAYKGIDNTVTGATIGVGINWY